MSLDPASEEGPAALAGMQARSYSNTILVPIVLILQLNSMVFNAFSKLNDSVILWLLKQHLLCIYLHFPLLYACGTKKKKRKKIRKIDKHIMGLAPPSNEVSRNSAMNFSRC